MADSEVFDLTWRDFSTHLITFSNNLLQNDSLKDISIQCGGGEMLRAHRLILAACSPWFNKVISALPPSGQPVIALWDTDTRVMSCILAFMYRGKIQVQQEDLPMFLKVAERLEVKGLVDKGREEVLKGAVAKEEEVNEEEEELKQMEEFERLAQEAEKWKKVEKFKDNKSAVDHTPKFNQRKEELKVQLERERKAREMTALAAKREAERRVRNTLLKAEVKKDPVPETKESQSVEQAKKQRMRELRTQALKEAMEAKEKKKEEMKEKPQEEQAKDKKAIMKALRMKAVNEAMAAKTKNTSLEEQVVNKLLEPMDTSSEEEYFDPSSLVEAEMNEMNEEDVNIPSDEALLTPMEDGRVFCTICKGGPMQKKRLTTHMKHKHGGETFECVPCNKTFTCKAYLTNHQKSACKERFKNLRDSNTLRS